MIRIAKSRHVHSHAIHQGEIKAARATLVIAALQIIEDSPRFQGPTSASGQEHRHLVGLMAVSVEKIRAAQQHRIIQEGLAPFIDLLQPLNQIGELLRAEIGLS